MQYIQTKTVYIDRDELIEIKAIEHDVKTRFIDFKFIAANKILDISHCIVRVYALNSKGNEIFNNLTIIDGAKGIAQLELTDSLLVPGTTEYKLKIYTDNGGILSSNRFNLIVSPDLMTGNAIEGSNEYTALDEALRTVGNIHATEVRSKENASNIAKITEKLDYTSERMQDNTETIIYNLKNREGSYGDCIVIKSDDGTFSMIDCFMEENYQIMIEQLDKIGVTKLKYFFATHDHSDHIGNAPAIIEKYRPDFIVFKDGIDYSRLPATEQEWDTKGYHDRMLAAADKFNVQKIVANDQQFRIGKNDYIEAFASKFYDYTNENSMSVNYLLVSHGTKSLFPGDSTTATETHLQNRIGKIDLYKLSHHGADGGNSDKRFEELQARYCLIDRLDVYKKDIIKNFALKCLKYGGKVYSNDNNDMTVFKITRGAIYPCCNEYKLPLQFLDYYSGRYKMTNEAGGIATKGIYPYKSDFYFVKDDGFIAKNEWIKHDGIDYHASSSGALDRNCFIQGTFNEKSCYYWIDENCKMVIEPKLIYYNNNTYIIKSNTLMAEEEFYEYQANYYYAGKGGALKKNEWLYKDSNYYWLKFNGVMASEETLFIEGKWYDFNGSGVCTNPSAGRDTKAK
ncbi:BppU family phage baseplate upper protein [Clostridium perfringens]|uniref:BppU family phage baseplate upper protein n=1 Tax=Clostridium perfringens TaxID=1502 RepID=UPI001ABAA620|nr:BppU family phage baseplate upper protein [Clostridium perfringens]MBO3393960.1 BppU family phage baseplate upper protein [Clostridium perfringens]MBO3399975.1 BppU family phage baseplate upper protein [Clostridium perfringens]